MHMHTDVSRMEDMPSITNAVSDRWGLTQQRYAAYISLTASRALLMPMAAPEPGCMTAPCCTPTSIPQAAFDRTTATKNVVENGSEVRYSSNKGPRRSCHGQME